MSNTDSPLHIAIKNNNIEIAKLLLEGQCDVHAVNGEGLTPLQLATQMGNAEMITLLFQHGAGNQPKPSPPPMAPKIVIAPGGHPPVDAMPPDVNQRKKRITFWTVFCMASYFLFMGASICLRALREQGVEEVVFAIGALLWLVIGLAYLYCFYMYMYRLWEEVPAEFARTTPGKAAGYSLIPVFNLYWWFTAFEGLHKDMNKTMESYAVETRFRTVWIKIVCICWLAFGVLQIIVMGPAPTFADGIFYMILTIPTLWIIRNSVLKFVDTKARMDINGEESPCSQNL